VIWKIGGLERHNITKDYLIIRMGFTCINKEEEINIPINEYIEQICKRNSGDSNIFNVNTNTNICLENFTGPYLDIFGATKPITGLTMSCTGTPTTCYGVYNLSEIDDFTLLFNLSGSTQYTGYTGSLCYKLVGRDLYTITGSTTTDLRETGNDLITTCFNFSGITSATINNTIQITSLPNVDDDYMLRPYYEFVSKQCDTGRTFSLWSDVVQTNVFEPLRDWYFITTVSPPPPTILEPGNDTLEEITLYQQTYLAQDFDVQIPLEIQPIGDEVLFFVNGVSLTRGVDFVLENPNFPRTPPVLRILTSYLKETDSIKIVYLIGPQSALQVENGGYGTDLFTIDNFIVTGFTTNLTASTQNIVNINTTIIPNTQEIYLENDYSETDNIVLFINGISLLENVEFFRSRSSKNKLILNPNLGGIEIGDIISIWYFQPRSGFAGNLGSLDTDSVTISWNVEPLKQPLVNVGKFILETKKINDTWDTIYKSDEIDYVDGVINYTLVINNLDLKEKYNYRVVFEKIYKSQLNNDVITRSYSVEGYFDTMKDSLSYSY
jgi:hypothetical protein